jgi:hypothetical protein
MTIVAFRPRRRLPPRAPDGEEREWRTSIIPAVGESRAYGLWKGDWQAEDLGPVIAWSCCHYRDEPGEVIVNPVTIYGVPECDEWCVVDKDGRVEGTAYESATEWAAGVKAWHEAWHEAEAKAKAEPKESTP